ncbi:BCS1 and AAA domain-containing protein [Aspergillus affinis]|uniref:BCS1 and AAA domain-containing protein n=1 Tax=Aspergillus affinis TaxID=1070780 RepID=UPI0022FE7583|nr:P-loop containing nucleoside triphosphate hydrolase protein [Aspergillus affinis]KAI9035825.1 P-loop containing nucleoside triphosphate hydrolase protein [Aspergillus affinis]
MLPSLIPRLLMNGDLSSIKQYLPKSLQLEDSPLFNIIVPIATILGTVWALWNRGYPFVESYMVNARILDTDSLYDDMVRWMDSHSSFISFDARGDGQNDPLLLRRAQTPKIEYGGAAFFSLSGHESSTVATDHPLSSGFHLVPSKGSWFFSFKRTLIHLKLVPMGGPEATRAISIHCMTRSVATLRSFLEEVRTFSKNQATSYVSVYRITPGREIPRWSRVTSRPARYISTVILDESKKEAIVKDIKEYLHPRTRQWYSNHGIPYRRGYLLSGPPGTGKSSLAGAIAGMFELDIYVLGLNEPEISENHLTSLFSRVPPHSVVLVEDVDAAGVNMSRPPKMPTVSPLNRNEFETPKFNRTIQSLAQPVSLSGLLNAIDGVASHEGRILIMTTNVPESLDRALIRPGRVDLHVKFTLPGRKEFQELFRSMYSGLEEFEEESCSGRDIEALSSWFAAQLPENHFSVADVQGFILQHKLHPEQACEKIGEWIEQRNLDLEKGGASDDKPRSLGTQTNIPDNNEHLLDNPYTTATPEHRLNSQDGHVEDQGHVL